LQTRTIRNTIVHNMNPESNRTSGPAGCTDTGTETVPETILDSDELLGKRQQVLIRHEGRLYRLRRTRLGKLILTA
jgi:hemin uptake protein HemP